MATKAHVSHGAGRSALIVREARPKKRGLGSLPKRLPSILRLVGLDARAKRAKDTLRSSPSPPCRLALEDRLRPVLTESSNFCRTFLPDGKEPEQSTTPNLTDPFSAFAAVLKRLVTASLLPLPLPPVHKTAHVSLPRNTSCICLRLYVER